MKNSILLLTFTIILNTVLNSQTLSNKWAGAIGDKSEDLSTGICTDSEGNTYMIGYYKDSTDLDPSSAVAKFKSKGGYDFFIAKYNIDGQFLWGKSMGSPSTEFVNGIGIDTSGNLYVVGTFRDKMDFDPSVNVFELNTAGGDDVFFAKYDNDGNLLWAKKIGGTNYENGVGIAVEKGGNVYITGSFNGTIDFDPNAGTSNLSAIVKNAYIAKYTTAGNLAWAKSLGGTWDDYGQAVTLDKDNNVIVSGTFNGTVYFDPGGSSSYINSSGGEDIFIAKYSSSGNYAWAISIGTVMADIGDARSIKTDNDGNIYITGMMYGSLDFDPSSNSVVLKSFGTEDVYIAKYNSSGVYQWAGNIGGTSDDRGQCLAIDYYGNVYCGGYFKGTADFNIGPDSSKMTSNGNGDIFIVKYNSSGLFKSAYKIGGSNMDIALCLAIAKKTDLRVSGYFSGNVDFDPSASDKFVNSAGGNDAFLIGFCGTSPEMPGNIIGDNVICANQSYGFSVPNDTIASSYQWTYPIGSSPVGNKNSNSITLKAGTNSGKISVKAVNSCGISGESSINVTVNSMDLTLSLSITTLTANESNATYRWLNCSDYSVISNATSQSFTPIVSGQYAVEITKNNCVDTSECRTVFMTNLNSIQNVDFRVYPNPSKGEFKLVLPNEINEYDISIYNSFGQKVSDFKFDRENEGMVEMNASEGVYIVLLRLPDGTELRTYLVLKY